MGIPPILLSVKIKRTAQKPCIFIGSSLKDLRRFSAKVKNRVGFALNAAQEGGEPIGAKALRGFGGRTVLELVEDFDSDTYSGRLYGRVCWRCVRASCLPEEGEERHRHTTAGHRIDQVAVTRC
jgi:hypothetical protein